MNRENSKHSKSRDPSRGKSAEAPDQNGEKEMPPKLHPHSKKIKKPKVTRFNRDKFGKIQYEKETEEAKKKFFEEINNFEEFVRTNTNKYKKIRKKTIEVVQVDKTQLKEAVKALLSHYEDLKRKLDLMHLNHDFINLEITVSKGLEAYYIKPIQISIPYPIYKPEYGTIIGVIAKDGDKIIKQPPKIPMLNTVTGVGNLLKEKKELKKFVRENNLYYCDHKIYNLLKKKTNKVFFQKKRIPYPIDTENVPSFLKSDFKTHEDYLKDLSQHTYFCIGNGPTFSLKIARTSQGVKEICKNVLHGIYNTIPHILRYAQKHTTIQQVTLRVVDSIAIPVFKNANLAINTHDIQGDDSTMVEEQ
mmetsp:Transcript_26316/g.30488  ORF Transcript_26316/g.30488 Transcript_26316/m.30488 type:complete len:360 (+) Transcript_26316:31-1110(+)